MSVVNLDDAFSWATSISCTRLASVARFGLQTTVDAEAVSDLQSILRIIQDLNIPHIPYQDLRFIEPIGEGVTFSVVTHFWGEKIVALKYIKQPGLNEARDRNAFRKRLKSVVQEILVMHHKPLAEHPNILTLLGYGWQQTQSRPSPYIAVEYGSLGSLRAFLQSQKPWALRNKLILAGDIAAGLTALHRAAIVHGDFKLDNVVCFQTWSRPTACIAKVCDFGHSMVIPENPKTVYYYGTPRYLPPEAFTQHKHPISSTEVHKCDIWAFGLALWELLIDGDVYFQSSWRDKPEFSYVRTSRSILESQEWSIIDSPQMETSGAVDSNTRQSHRRAVFGDFDLGLLRTLGMNMVKNLNYARFSGAAFARSYLLPLMKLTLDPDPASRLSDLSRSPIMASWRSVAPQSALESKLAFHTHNSHLGFDMFRPDRQANIAWNTQAHIYDDIKSVTDSKQVASTVAQAALQLALCRLLGFGCEINKQDAVQHMTKGLEHDTALAAFIGGPLQASLDRLSDKVFEPFSVRLANIFSSQWDVDIATTVSLREKPSFDSVLNENESPSDLMKITALRTMEDMLLEATTTSLTTPQAVISQSVIYFDKQRLSLSWLDLAIVFEDTPFIETNIEHFSIEDLNRLDDWTNSPLILACCRNLSGAVMLLLGNGADPEISTPEGLNLLHVLFCLKDEAVGVLRVALNLCPSLISKINQPCQRTFITHPQWPTEVSGTPLAIAVTARHLELVQELLVHGATGASPAFSIPTEGGRNVWTPLHIALKYNFPEIVQAILHANPDSFVQLQSMDEGRFPLAMALSYLTCVERYGVHGSSSAQILDDTMRLLPKELLNESSPKGSTPLLQALDFENREAVSSFLRHSPELAEKKIVDPSCSDRFTLPLHFACQISGHRNTPDALLIPKMIVETSRQTLQMVDDAQRSALHLAVTSDFSIVTEWLVSEGLDVNVRDSSGRTPLMLSHSKENTKALIALGADISLQDRQGRNAAYYAVSRRDHETLSLLMGHGIDPNVASNSGRTLLHDAVQTMSLECVRALCRAGVGLRVRDANGATPLHLAVLTTADIVLTLVEKGSDIFLTDAKGESALQKAVIRMNDPASDPRQSGNILKSLISPLCGTLEAENRNRSMLLEALHTCARFGNCESILIFLNLLHRDSLITVNEPYQGRPPLHSAILSVNMDTGRALVQQGRADVNARDVSGRTALMLLCSSQHRGEAVAQFYNLLIAYGASVDACNEAGECAWTLAVRCQAFRLLTGLLNDFTEDMLASNLAKLPLTQEHLLAAIDVEELDLVLAFSRKASLLPAAYEPKLSAALAKALLCPNEWAAISRRFGFVWRRYPECLRSVIEGLPPSRALRLALLGPEATPVEANDFFPSPEVLRSTSY